ncbi:SRPBCC family protein [Jiangella aurantiaca]|uniref:SRPBCC family protein n=1 Tax=Jiangella aurantiaca TaxID=2530373 RepID=A0A4R5A1G0_9ACTN|nr:SRPBCC family protein [Jiangella aurantiaca]TDD65688.1 SRPBCC family protein [Jiangella aurantiaca]
MTAPGTVRRTVDGRVEIRFERRFAHSPAKLWQALTDPAELRAWRFPAVVELDLAPGATLYFHPTDEQRERFGVTPEPVAGRMIVADPPRLLEYTWGTETLRWELTPDGDGCRLVFRNTIGDDGAGPAVAGGWHAGLELLEAALSGRAVDWDIWQRAADLQKQYEEQS